MGGIGGMKRFRCICGASKIFCCFGRRSKRMAARSGRLHRRDGQDPPVTKTIQRPTDMAFTPSKDAKRREREQKKMDKRLARDEEKAQKLAAQRAAEEAAANDTSNMTEAEIQAKLEADFEAELAAEAAA
ncbi:MAG: hypothetical protein EOP84_01540 [Verrucomicrobiaceae bacterium]|nr:MAG: hypothetical protein EOP84_01540 [Verrucomicrobiaceae bacterium]